MQDNLKGLSWLLPTTVLVFVGYILFATLGAFRFGLPLWLVLIPSFPAIGLTAVALVIALLDVTRRPKSQLSDETRIVWVMVLIILPIVGLLPYWLIVMRRTNSAS